MSKGRSSDSKKTIVATYALAKRMENAGVLRPGTAMLLAASVGKSAPKPKRGTKK